jgi:hypothetical protein
LFSLPLILEYPQESYKTIVTISWLGTAEMHRLRVMHYGSLRRKFWQSLVPSKILGCPSSTLLSFWWQPLTFLCLQIHHFNPPSSHGILLCASASTWPFLYNAPGHHFKMAEAKAWKLVAKFEYFFYFSEVNSNASGGPVCFCLSVSSTPSVILLVTI